MDNDFRIEVTDVTDTKSLVILTQQLDQVPHQRAWVPTFDHSSERTYVNYVEFCNHILRQVVKGVKNP